MKLLIRSGLLALFLLLVNFVSTAQSITGIVHSRENGRLSPLVGAFVYWSGTTQATTTDTVGHFTIELSKSTNKLVISFVGYQPDTISVLDQPSLVVILSQAQFLQEVVVQGSSTQIDRLSPHHTELLTTRTLAKAACCNLSESFETNASVNVTMGDAVTGARQIQLLGLSGNYVQMNVENIPTIRGLASPFGLNYIPGTWIRSIDIGKGAGSVVNGYESMTGTINVELQKPDQPVGSDREKVYLNAYGNSFGRVEGNINVSLPVSKSWSVGLLSHASTLQSRVDQNGDGFLDLPLYTQYNGVLRAKYNRQRFMAQVGIKALIEDRMGGQVLKNAPTLGYKFGIDTRRIELFSKMARLYPEKPYKGLGLILNASSHDQHANFGFVPYDGRQRTLYGNLIYQSIIDNTNHAFKAGMSYLLDDYRERYRDTLMTRTESVPGIFGEYTYTYPERFVLVVGNRIDFHNRYGVQVTPRLHMKYHLHEVLTFRASVGRGFRVPNPLAENFGYLVSSRTVYFSESIRPEVSWNYGGSLTYEVNLFGRKGSFVLDYYRTVFQNQLVMDVEHPRALYFYNLNGRSFSNSFQVELNYQPMKRFDLKIAYRLFDVRQALGAPFGESVVMPRMMISRDRVLFNAGYALPYDKWKVDFTIQWNGPKRIPYLREGYVHTDYQNMPYDRAPSYYNINAQVSKAFRLWELYVGGENLGNFRQRTPINGASDPFGRDFDAAARVWGPITGRMIYTGFRLKI